MQEYIDFAFQNPILSVAWVVLLLAWIVLSLRQRLVGSRIINRQQATLIANREHGIILDIRDDKAYQQGHIAGARRMDLSQLLKAQSSELEPFRDQPIIVVCETGMQSNKAAAALIKSGFEKTYILEGGMSGWRSERLPMAR